jgi:trans-2,3-dihydro-3-hydroxyanthranilate isomerase
MQAKPDLAAIEALSREHGLVGITPFCLDAVSQRYDYHIRAIAPYLGVAEDPVCGTGNGCVASYLANFNFLGGGETFSLTGEEGQEVGRPGSVYVTVRKKGAEITGVSVGGTAVTILEGVIYA